MAGEFEEKQAGGAESDINSDPAVLLSEARERAGLLEQSLPTLVDPISLSVVSKVPYKVIACREALIWRTEELARSACDLFDRKDIVAGILLTRAVTENASTLWYLRRLMEKSIERGPQDNLDDRIMSLLLGSRDNPEMPNPISVLTTVDEVEKTIPGFKSNYDRLSEYSHPNWSGASYIYSQIDHDQILTNFGKSPRGLIGPLKFGLSCLNVSLALFEHAYNGISDLIPKFIVVCESAVGSAE